MKELKTVVYVKPPALDIPESGQFVFIWEYKGEIWSQTAKWVDGDLYGYLPNKDKWELDSFFWLTNNYPFKAIQLA